MNKTAYIIIKKILLFIENSFFWPMAYFHGSGLLKELTPYDVDYFKEKVRIGSINDGGYVMPSNILPNVEVLYSYGIGENADFEEDISKRLNIPVRMYDHSIKEAPSSNSKLFFKREGIAKNKKGDFNTFEGHLRENNDVGRKILLKMDIEGNEWEVIGQILDYYWQNIVAIILEIHMLYRYEKVYYYIKKLRGINSKFTLVHIHGNNNKGLVDSSIIDYKNKKIPSTCELTFLNNIFVKNKSVMNSFLPSKLDRPNVPGQEDIHLDFWK